MSRGLSGSVLTEIAKSQRHLAHFFEFGFSTPEYYTSHPRDLSWNSINWVSSGNVIEVGDIVEDINSNVNSVQMTLSGANTANYSVALSENYVHLPVKIYMAFIDSSDNVIDAANLLDGRIQYFSFDENQFSGKATLTWEVASHWADWERKAGRYTNNADQQVYFPGDEGFEFAGQVVKELLWGRTS